MNLTKYPFKGSAIDKELFIRGIISARAEGKTIERRNCFAPNGKWHLFMSRQPLDWLTYFYRVKPDAKPKAVKFNFDKFPLSMFEGFSDITAVRPPPPWPGRGRPPATWRVVNGSETVIAGDIAFYKNSGCYNWAYGLIGNTVKDIEHSYTVWRRPAPFNYDKFPKGDYDHDYGMAPGAFSLRVPSVPSEWVQLDKSEIVKPGDIVRLSDGLEWAYGYIGEKVGVSSSGVAYRRPVKIAPWSFKTAPKCYTLIRDPQNVEANCLILNWDNDGIATHNKWIGYLSLSKYEYSIDNGKTWNKCVTTL